MPFRLTLEEPAELPICLLHVGAEAEVLAGLDTEVLSGLDTGLNSGLDTGLDSGLGAANSPLAAETGSVSDLGAMDGLALAEYFEDTLDPAATVRALSDTALCRLADALYRQLSTPPALPTERIPGTSSRPRSFRTATLRTATARRRTNWRRTRPWPEPLHR